MKMQVQTTEVKEGQKREFFGLLLLRMRQRKKQQRKRQ